MTRIAVTGAKGSVGTVTMEALEQVRFTAVGMDKAYTEDEDGLKVDILSMDEDIFENYDVVIHLAAEPDPYKDWDEIIGPNITGMQKVFRVAADNGVKRFIFASSNHVQHGYNIGDENRPETQIADWKEIDPEEPYNPDSPYAWSKVMGELRAEYYAKKEGMEVINMRIGWLLTKEELREKQEEDESVARYARAKWLSPRDYRNVIKKLVDVKNFDLPENLLTFNLRSDNDEGDLTIDKTMEALEYKPEDNSAEIVKN